VINVNNISKKFRSGRGMVHALSNVSFSVDTGDTLIVIGKSGSGKTTLLNCLGGLERPDNGRINCFGTEIHLLSAKAMSLFQRKHMGFVFQYGNLLSYLTVSENIALPLVLNGIDGKKKETRVTELLKKIELTEAAKAMPNELSGGEVQRVAFARAIAHLPKILMADEPSASLDSETGLNLIRMMTDLSKAHQCTLVISTHDNEIIKLSDNILNLLDGKVPEKKDE
jgi:ABC-type lipoprotein export system ATPase subunit